MENVIQNPGLQHITEMILFNLDFEDLKKCQILKKSFKDILDNSMFWLRKWRNQRGLSKKNHNDWVKAIQLTKNTNAEATVKLYLQKVIKNGHVVDIPCFIDFDAVEKSTEFTFKRALKERKLGIFQILASMAKNPKEVKDAIEADYQICQGKIYEGDVNIIKILVPISTNPTSMCGNGWNLINEAAAFKGCVNVLKFFIPFNNDPNCINRMIAVAAYKGHIDVLKLLAPLTNNPNEGLFVGLNPMQWAERRRDHEFAKILQSFINA